LATFGRGAGARPPSAALRLDTRREWPNDPPHEGSAPLRARFRVGSRRRRSFVRFARQPELRRRKERREEGREESRAPLSVAALRWMRAIADAARIHASSWGRGDPMPASGVLTPRERAARFFFDAWRARFIVFTSVATPKGSIDLRSKVRSGNAFSRTSRSKRGGHGSSTRRCSSTSSGSTSRVSRGSGSG